MVKQLNIEKLCRAEATARKFANLTANVLVVLRWGSELVGHEVRHGILEGTLHRCCVAFLACSFVCICMRVNLLTFLCLGFMLWP